MPLAAQPGPVALGHLRSPSIPEGREADSRELGLQLLLDPLARLGQHLEVPPESVPCLAKGSWGSLRGSMVLLS